MNIVGSKALEFWAQIIDTDEQHVGLLGCNGGEAN